MKPIRIIVAGAKGRMGSEVIRLIQREEGLELAAAVSRSGIGEDIGEAVGIGRLEVPIHATLSEALLAAKADVLVDFTVPDSVEKHLELALQAGIRPVVGTSGLDETTVETWSQRFREQGLGGVVAPNFAIGAVLMMMFAAKAARYMPHVEIIEMHHDRKLDAPSGTAVKTAEMVTQSRQEIKQGHPEETETWDGARGAYKNGFRVHSVRLPGLVAHQEVLLGGPGQLLTIRHDSLNRESFMPGVKLAVERAMELEGLVYGLEHLLGD
ncbi:4-hydroxy-tetrahydrodipicolinate reductase [Desmospora profundinema]|uniref:4-hydroxy-tetrahydrodipicolinate reductase n=1 Tax=Desmospora profundinema TaxID=1571184 RepID=A0ABU1IJA5_9BACL|nr:4-hydroxy-tetrahydrodipicolinate reductase [Desmospora profundinema]MDR6224478.1 4-hydroxy-tetrahydrodipicolinate reductase [Desmospora profundinema]